MNRPIVQAHTIEQWEKLDPVTQSMIKMRVRLKDRLLAHIASKRKKGSPLKEPKWVPCRNCDATGHILLTPRYAGIHPSQIAHSCLLRLYNEMIGVSGQEKIEPRTQLIFDVGTAIHEILQTYGKEGAWGPRYEKEVVISPEHQELADLLMIEGHADADNIITIDDIPGAPIYEVGVIHEYKSINMNGFEKTTKAKPEHLIQAAVYSATLNRPLVAFLYMNKNDSNLADFVVPFERDFWEKLESKAKVLVDHFNRQEAPPANTGYHCTQCPYQYSCEAAKQNAAQIKARK